MAKKLLLNCDLGESLGNWNMGNDAAVMPFIDQANIACGFHAGDPVTMQRTLQLAAAHDVAVGAHPAYPDIVGFGRRPMALSSAEIIATMHYQIAALDGLARNQGIELSYVKPHGALYHAMMSQPKVRAAIIASIASYHRRLPLMMQATGQVDSHREEAHAQNVDLLFEIFADRAYNEDGSLVPRTEPHAVLNREQTLARVAQLMRDHTISTASGKSLLLQADTLCVHGDNAEGVSAIEAIRALVNAG
jgi:UPF0271 protein